MRALLATFALAAFFLAGCDAARTGDANRYTLRLSDDTGVVANGELVFDERPRQGAAVAGTYTLIRVGGGPFPPFTESSGDFEGSYESSDTLTVRLLAGQLSDSGLRLQGAHTGTVYSGTWDEITIAGPQPRGTFAATSAGD